MIPYYEVKWHYLNWHQRGQCPMALEMGNSYVMLHEFHHKKHNTKINRKRWPLFIDSLLNLELVNHRCHMMYPSHGKISDLEADRIEDFLRRHSKICRWVNTLKKEQSHG